MDFEMGMGGAVLQYWGLENSSRKKVYEIHYKIWQIHNFKLLF